MTTPCRVRGSSARLPLETTPLARAVDLSSLPRGDRPGAAGEAAGAVAAQRRTPGCEPCEPAAAISSALPPAGTPARRAATPARTRRPGVDGSRAVGGLGAGSGHLEHRAPRQRHRARRRRRRRARRLLLPRRVGAAGRPASACRPTARGLLLRQLGRSKPVAMTVIFTLPVIFGSTTAPKMMLASSCAASWMIADASLTSTSDRSGPPVTLMITPRAPLTDASSSSGLEIARVGRLHRAVLAFGDAGAHHRQAHARHDRLHVGEVEVDQPGHEDQVRDALNRLPQHVVGAA